MTPMAIEQEYRFSTEGGPNAILARGAAALTPDAGGGFYLSEAHPEWIGARVVATYNNAVVFVGANAGFLLTEVDAQGRVLVVSSNVADNNGIQWVLLK